MILTHDGITQPVEEWARDYGIPCRTIRMRLNRGWTVADAVDTPVRVRMGRKGPVYSFDGLSLTLTEWSRLSGISVDTLHSRLRHGWSIGRAVTERPQRVGRGVRRHGGGYQATSAASQEDRRPRHAQDCA